MQRRTLRLRQAANSFSFRGLAQQCLVPKARDAFWGSLCFNTCWALCPSQAALVLKPVKGLSAFRLRGVCQEERHRPQQRPGGGKAQVTQGSVKDCLEPQVCMEQSGM